jgi:hypothetical protein
LGSLVIFNSASDTGWTSIGQRGLERLVIRKQRWTNRECLKPRRDMALSPVKFRFVTEAASLRGEGKAGERSALLAKRLKQATYGSRQYNYIVDVSRQSRWLSEHKIGLLSMTTVTLEFGTSSGYSLQARRSQVTVGIHGKLGICRHARLG